MGEYRVGQTDGVMMEEQIQGIVAAELERMPEPRRSKLAVLLVHPQKATRDHGYRPGSSICWIVAVAPAALLVYCEGGLSEHYRWGILDPKTSNLGGDDTWHASLDDAFMNSGLCDRTLVPPGYEVP